MGKIVGTIRRMGQDFQREINKTTGLDTVTDLRKSITEPLKKTTAEIRKEFNAIGANGTVKPTGVIKPTDPKVESVVDSIKTQAGMTTPAEPVKTGAAAATAAPAAATTASAPVKAAVLPKVNAAPTAPVTVADLPTIEASTPATPDPVAKTPRKRTRKAKAGRKPRADRGHRARRRQARAQAAEEGRPPLRRARAAARAAADKPADEA